MGLNSPPKNQENLSREDRIIKKLDTAAQKELDYETRNKISNSVIGRNIAPAYDNLLGYYGTSEEFSRRISELVDIAKRYTTEELQKGEIKDASWAWGLAVRRLYKENLSDEEKKALQSASIGEAKRQLRSVKSQNFKISLEVPPEKLLEFLLIPVKDL